MAIAAVVWLGYQFWRLLWGSAPIWPTSPPGAIDLKLLHRLVHHWFAGHQVYREFGSAVYPPATYVLLWPLQGWLELAPARWLWGFTTVVALSVLIYFLVRESGADRPRERAFVALLACSIYATGAAIGNGQLILHLLPIILATLFLLRREARGWREDLLAAGLMIAAMVKPQIALPFLWLALFVTRSWRPVLLAGIGYGLVTLFAVSFQEAAPGELLRDWRLRLAAVTGGYGNVANLHVWLDNLGLEEWKFPVSLLVWLALGFWVYRHRAIDLWILLAVTAYVTCFWTYHRWYDDVLLLLPMVALFRIIKREPSTGGSGATAGVLLGAALLLTLAPGGLFLLPPPWNTAYVYGQTILWIATLMFLLGRARAGRGVEDTVSRMGATEPS
jgi:Glycosyltransferase family 87